MISEKKILLVAKIIESVIEEILINEGIEKDKVESTILMYKEEIEELRNEFLNNIEVFVSYISSEEEDD